MFCLKTVNIYFIFFIGMVLFFSIIQKCECLEKCQATDPRFFGPSCKYEDARYLSQEILIGTNKKTKGDVCMFVKEGEKVSIDLGAPAVIVRWIRVIVQNVNSTTDLQVTFTSKGGDVVDCPGEKRAVMHTIVDIVCQFQTQIVKYINVEGDINSTCDIFISMGRNINQQGNSTQSTILPGHGPHKCNDGSEKTFCHTALENDTHPWWMIEFDFPAQISYYRIVNRKGYEQRAFRHAVVFRDVDDDVKWVHNDIHSSRTEIFTEYVTAMNQPIKTFQFFINPDLKETILNIMEFQFFSHLVCPDGSYGMVCDKTCNCLDRSETCFPMTGGCPQGCAVGFHGKECKEPCEDGKYGKGCNETCSKGCKDGCHKFDGKCDVCRSGYHGSKCDRLCSIGCVGDCNKDDGECVKCKSGYQGLMCDETCTPGFFGDMCRFACFYCANPVCNPHSGLCERSLCQPGWLGEDCSKKCPKFTWGDKCKDVCSKNCAGDGLCRNTNGMCVHGCKSVFQPPNCVEKIEASKTFKKPVSRSMYVPIIIGLLAVIPFICFAAWCIYEDECPEDEGE